MLRSELATVARSRWGTALLVATSAWFAVWFAFPLPHLWRVTAMNIALAAVCAIAAAAAFAASRRRRDRARRSFFLLGVATTSWAAGQLAWTYYELRTGEMPFPSVADVGYLGSLLFGTIALLLWPRTRRGSSAGARFEAALAIGLAWLAGWTFGFAPLVGRGVSTSAEWLPLAYPLVGLVLLSFVIAGLLLDGWEERGRLVVVGLALLGLIVSDVLFALAGDGYVTGASPVDFGRTLAFLTVGIAALLPPGFAPHLRARSLTGPLAAALGAVLAALLVHQAVGEWRAYDATEAIEDTLLSAALLVLLARTWTLARARDREAAALRTVERDLRDAQTARERFVVQLVNEQDREARRIADLLHDDVVQQLTALQLRLELQAQRLDAPSLMDLAAGSRSIIGSIRQLLVELHPAILESQGLAPAVEVAAEPLRERGIDVRVRPFPHRLAREREVLAYRLAQQALENVLRYSGATSAEVEFAVEDHTLRGRVTDTGRGVAVSSDADIGLVVARERAELAGGRLLVRSEPGVGTDVLFELPLGHEDPTAGAVSL